MTAANDRRLAIGDADSGQRTAAPEAD